MNSAIDQNKFADCKDLDAVKELFNLKIEYIIKDQKDFFDQKEKNERWRAIILGIIFGPLLTWNGWMQVQSKKEFTNLSNNIVDYIEWKAEQRALNKETAHEMERIKDAMNECRATHGFSKFK